LIATVLIIGIIVEMIILLRKNRSGDVDISAVDELGRMKILGMMDIGNTSSMFVP